MPYLTSFDKIKLDHIVTQLVMTELQVPGQLNYLFTKLILQYVKDKGESYQTYNDCMGALECAQFELYRRRIAAYEDSKAEVNGDVFKTAD